MFYDILGGVDIRLCDARAVAIGFHNLGVVSFVPDDVGVVVAGSRETGVVRILHEFISTGSGTCYYSPAISNRQRES